MTAGFILDFMKDDENIPATLRAAGY